MGELLYYITPNELNDGELKELLIKHSEIKFVSLLGIDLGGNGTDEKIPINIFTHDIDSFLKFGVQTDGSSVVLHEIATLNNARVDIIPDTNVKWFIDYNISNNKTVGTLRIPSFLIHNKLRVDSRSILDNAVNYFKESFINLIVNNPEFLTEIGVNNIQEIEEIIPTSATELEFWVQTPEDTADIEKLYTSQLLKEQYWKRTRGTVRDALEETLEIMGKYGLQPEMGHKEVGGIKSKIGVLGKFTHVMEQLEIDWKYSTSLQSADNELIAREIVGDTFRRHGLEVTFAAKPINNVAGSGEHTHIGVCAKLCNGNIVNLFSPAHMKSSYLSNIGYGALMGFLKNYEIISPLITSSSDAFNRLKPGFEAPVCIVSSLGHNTELPSRNRSVLVGVIRDVDNPLATRFEVRSPNPRSNTYLLLAGIYQSMLDGITYSISCGKSVLELEAELSKKYGENSDYLDINREYRCEEDVFENLNQGSQNEKFGVPPVTVWENIKNLSLQEQKKDVLLKGNVFTPEILESYRLAIITQWCAELEGRIIPENIETVRQCIKLHDNQNIKDIDTIMWEKVNSLRYYLMKDSIDKKSLFTRTRDAIAKNDYSTVSYLEIEISEKMQKLNELYAKYKKNLFEFS